jgi:ketosteroid isomerase-like protein
MAKKSGKTARKPAKKAAAKRVVKKAKRAAAPQRRAAKKVVKKAAVKKKAVAKQAPRPAAARPSPDRAMRDLAKRIIDVTLANDDDAAFALYADNIESAEMGMPPSVGIEAIRQKFAMWRSMVSDAVFQPRRVWVDGNTIIVEWDGRVTLAANGNTVDLPEIAIHEIENGKIARERFYYDPTILRP